MKTMITRIAAVAAVIAVAVTVGTMMFGGRPAFAQVIKPILQASTVVFDFIVGDEATGSVIHDVVVGQRIRRTFSGMPTVLVLDLDNAKMLTLDPNSKTAVYVDIQGPLVEGTRSLMGLVRDIVNQIAAHPEDVQDLGRRTIDGVDTIGYLVKDQNVRLNIWADAAKATPIRIELYEQQSVTVLKNIEFDVPVDGSLISVDVPAGYALEKTDLKMGDATEQDFVEALRIWGQHINDGTFPEVVSADAMMKAMPLFVEKMGRLNVSAEEGTKLGMTLGKGMVFLTMLDHQGEWRYGGKGVTVGDAKAAIFWYRRGEAKTYRVIYGDLHVEDVGLDRLPQ